MNSQRGVVSMAIYSALVSHEPQVAQAWDQQFQEPMDQTVHGQIAAANRFWRGQLGTLPISTVDIRDCLVDHCDLHDWIRMFNEHVLPVILAFQLPQSASLCAA